MCLSDIRFPAYEEAMMITQQTSDLSAKARYRAYSYGTLFHGDSLTAYVTGHDFEAQAKRLQKSSLCLLTDLCFIELPKHPAARLAGRHGHILRQINR